MWVPKWVKFWMWVFIDIGRAYRRRKLGLPPSVPFGVELYIGLPGKGKTISIVERLERLRVRHPGIRIGTNFNWVGQDFPVNSWREVVDFTNGEKGVVFALDEIQLTFNTRDWSSFPAEMVTLLTQNRKERKLILASAQSFDRVDKVFRELCNHVIRCNTLFGRWTFNRAFLTEEYQAFRSGYSMGRKAITSWRYNFIQTDWLRSRFDTLLRLQALSSDALSGELLGLSEIERYSENQVIVVQERGKKRK